MSGSEKVEITRDTIINEIKRIAEQLGKNQLSLSEFRSNSKISDWHIWKIFESWNDAVEEAGLNPHMEKQKMDDEELFKEMLRVFETYGDICNRTKFSRISKFSVDVYKKRFGKWNNILRVFKNWIETNSVVFPYESKLTQIIIKPVKMDEELILAE